MEVEFTARHPEIVEKLLLFGAYPRGTSNGVNIRLRNTKPG